MPGSLYRWYGARELEALAKRGGTLQGELDLERLPRLAELLNSDRGSVKAALRFRQQGGWLIIALEHAAVLELTCQRCLEPVAYRLEDTVELAVLESPSQEQRRPEGLEPLVLEDERFRPATLVEDELIIALPFVPRHESIEACGSLARDSVLLSDPEREERS
ncbi:MAG TPA: YceD family protein [Gammaproteobacteria bacterium]|nr:YceD family protein [Gammaproteobacteria bacterium]